MWCCRRMEKTSWTDCVKKYVLHRVKEERNSKYTINRKKSNWICHNSRSTSFLKHVLEGKVERKIEVKRRRGRRRKQLLMTLRKRDETRNWKREN
jgi:hypothetical protein